MESPKNDPQSSDHSPVDAEAQESGPKDETATVEFTPQGMAEQLDTVAELEQQKDRLLRLQAEMQNLRQRTSREIADERRYGAIELMRAVLPVLDNVDRAIEAADKKADADQLLEGFKMVRQMLVSTLEQHGCEEIEAHGQPFDPDFHEAIQQLPSPEHPAGTISMVTQSGYKLHDRVVRAPQVIVSSGPADG